MFDPLKILFFSNYWSQLLYVSIEVLIWWDNDYMLLPKWSMLNFDLLVQVAFIWHTVFSESNEPIEVKFHMELSFDTTKLIWLYRLKSHDQNDSHAYIR